VSVTWQKNRHPAKMGLNAQKREIRHKKSASKKPEKQIRPSEL
jgi:hypothetical protein